MRVTRLYTGPDNETYFEELEIPLERTGWVASSERMGVEDAMFVDILRPPGDPGDFHNAPQRQFVVVLEGVMEVRTASGESRRWGPGEVLLPDDTTGHGHLKTVIKQPARLLFIKLPDDFDPAKYRVTAGS